MGIGRTIRELRKQAHLTQGDLAKAVGAGQSAVSHWESGDSVPSLDKIPKLAKILDVSVQTLLEKLDDEGMVMDDLSEGATASEIVHEVDSPVVTPYMKTLEMAVLRSQSIEHDSVHNKTEATVPLVTLGKVHAGQFSSEELVGQSVEVPVSVLRNHPTAQALVVEGNCMNRVAGNGTIAVFDPDIEPTNGRIAIVETKDYEALMRRWHKGTDKLMLTSDSYEYYPDIVIEGDEPIHVLGTVVHIVTPQEKL